MVIRVPLLPELGSSIPFESRGLYFPLHYIYINFYGLVESPCFKSGMFVSDSISDFIFFLMLNKHLIAKTTFQGICSQWTQRRGQCYEECVSTSSNIKRKWKENKLNDDASEVSNYYVKKSKVASSTEYNDITSAQVNFIKAKFW